MQYRTTREVLGQGMVEYIIIVALIALAAIGAFSYFGKSVRGQTAQMAQQVAGQDVETGRAEAREGGDLALEQAGNDYGLNNYIEADVQGE